MEIVTVKGRDEPQIVKKITCFARVDLPGNVCGHFQDIFCKGGNVFENCMVYPLQHETAGLFTCALDTIGVIDMTGPNSFTGGGFSIHPELFSNIQEFIHVFFVMIQLQPIIHCLFKAGILMICF